MAAFTAKKVSKVKAFDADSSFSIEGMDNGSFAIASNKKELKQLMKSDADVVYYEKKGKLYLNENGEEKGWGAKKVGGLLAKFKRKPQLDAINFKGLIPYSPDPNISQEDLNPKNAGEKLVVIEDKIDKTLGRTAPVFNSMLPGTNFQVESDKKQDFVDSITGKTNSVKYELGEDLIIKCELNNNISSPIYNLTIYKGEFSYDGSVLNYAKIDGMISASVSDTFEEYMYWDFSEPRYFELQRALSFAGFSDFPATTSTDKDLTIQQSEGYLAGKWWENMFDQNRII